MVKNSNEISLQFKILLQRFPKLYIISKINQNGFKNTITNIKGYNAIKKHRLFDEKYYSNKYPNADNPNINPILHYMYHGFKEGKKPNRDFNGKFYVKRYNDVRKSKLNPLVHYSLYGIHEKRKTQPPSYSQLLRTKIDIVLCVHNALEDVKLCIESIIRKTSLNYRLIIVNDGSDDNTSNYLKEITKSHPFIILLKNDEAQGYTKAANKGLKFSDARYVVLINSDTIVTPYWLENIVICGASHPKNGLIGPLSNAASYQSVPKVKNSSGDWATNKLIPETSVDEIAKIIQKLSKRTYPPVPILNGFCLAIKRSVIKSIGYLDEENFPYGYGEENDYCLRAKAAGYRCVVADDAYVFHSKSKSFGHTKRSNLSEQGWNALKEKYDVNELAKILENLEKNRKLKRIRDNLSNHLETKFRSEYLEQTLEEKNEIIGSSIRIFIINKNKKDLTENTIHSINKLQTDVPITILSSENEVNLTDKIKNKLEIINYNEKEGFLNKVNEILLNKKEKFVLFLYSGDELERDFINILNKPINEKETAGISFDDEIIKDEVISRFKPGFSREYYLENDYIGNSILINRSKLIQIGGFDSKYPQNYIRDAVLRLSEQNYKIMKEDIIGLKISNEICEDPEELKSFLINTLDRNKRAYQLKTNFDSLRPVYNTEDSVASIIIPFKDHVDVTKKCVDSILELTEYPQYEIILLNNASQEKETIDYINKISANKKIRVLNYNKPFNYSEINNFASQKAWGEVLIFLNNDTEVISKNWLTELVGDATQPGIGAVGSKLYYPDGTLQHTGVIMGLNGLAGHLFSGENESEIPGEWTKYRRNVSAVTGACMAITKKTFQEIGGFFEEFEITGSDVEICLRLMENGYRNIINPQVKLIHHERKSRSKIKVREKDIQLSVIAYQPYLNEGDPFFNNNFSLNSNELMIKTKEEYPAYRAFLDKYYKEKIKKDMELTQAISKAEITSSDIELDNELLVFDVSPLNLEKNQELMFRFKRNPQLQLNKALWFIPFFDHVYRGGIYTIFRTAQHFSIKEGTTNIFVLNGGAERDFVEIEEELSAAFPEMKFELINLRQYGDEEELPHADAAFCTLWTSAYSLVKYNNCKAKYYFNQDFEPMFYAAGSVYGLIEQTYRFDFIGITNTEGVSEKYKKYNRWVTYFTPAVDKKIFYPDNAQKNKKKRVVFYGRPQNTRNGFRLGIEALKIVKSHFGKNVEIFSVGSEFNRGEYEVGRVLENLGLLPTIKDVAELYRTCDVGLVFMFTPHPSYQPLEYMASGCVTVTNINESNLWLLKDKENAILTEPTVRSVASNIIKILENDDLRNNIIKNGLETISSTNWEQELNQTIEFIKNPKIKWE